VLGRVATAVEMSIDQGSLRFEYERRFGGGYEEQTGSLKLQLHL
jgi:hypothetical protein